MNEVLKNDAAQAKDNFDLGQWLGRRQAYALVAGTCSAADAKCLNEIREDKKYKRIGLTWEEFCNQRLGMSRSTADVIIRQFREFGAAYFTLRQFTGITPQEYRAIRPAIEDGSLRHRDGAIPIAAEHAPRLLEAVRELIPPPEEPKGSADPAYRLTPRLMAAETALLAAREAVHHLTAADLGDAAFRYVAKLVSGLSTEMKWARGRLREATKPRR